MSQFTPNTFKEAINSHFAPIAREHGWPVERLSESSYQIASPHCTLIVDYHDGAHSRSMNARLIPNPTGTEKKLGNIGVWPIAQYDGEPFNYTPCDLTAECFLEEAAELAGKVRNHCVPFLLGQRSDWNEVYVAWQRYAESEMEEIRQLKLPSRVQKRWHLPPPLK